MSNISTNTSLSKSPASSTGSSSTNSNRVSSPQICRSCRSKDETIVNLQSKLEQVESSFRSVVAALKKNQNQLKEKDRIINELVAKTGGNDNNQSNDLKRINELESSICELSTICGEYKSQRAKDKSLIDTLNEKIKSLSIDREDKLSRDIINDPSSDENTKHSLDNDENSCVSSTLKLVRNRSSQTDKISSSCSSGKSDCCRFSSSSHDTCTHQGKRVTVDASTQFSPSFLHHELSVSDTLTSASVTNGTFTDVNSSKGEVNCHHSTLNKSKKVTETAIVIPTRNEEVHLQSVQSIPQSKISCINVNVNQNDTVTGETSSLSSSMHSPSVNCHLVDASLQDNLDQSDMKHNIFYSTCLTEQDDVKRTQDTRKQVEQLNVPSSSEQLTIDIADAKPRANEPFTSLVVTASASYQHHQVPIQETVDCSGQRQSTHKLHGKQEQLQQQQQHISRTLGASSGVSLFYVNELARKEIELAEARLAAREYECALRELQWQSSVEKFRLKAKVTEYEKVRSQLAQLTASSSINQLNSSIHCDSSTCKSSTASFSTSNANLLYIKNVLLNYIKTNDKKQQKIILNALLTALDMEERV